MPRLRTYAGNMSKVLFVCSLFAGLACMLTACGGGGGEGAASDELVTSTAQRQSVNYTLSAKAVSKQGEAVQVGFTLSNAGATAIDVIVASYGPSIGIYKDATTVWDPNRNSAAFRVVLSLNPGETKNYVWSWNQLDNNGNPVAPGVYTVKVATGGGSDQISITIQ